MIIPNKSSNKTKGMHVCSWRGINPRDAASGTNTPVSCGKASVHTTERPAPLVVDTIQVNMTLSSSPSITCPSPRSRSRWMADSIFFIATFSDGRFLAKTLTSNSRKQASQPQNAQGDHEQTRKGGGSTSLSWMGT